MQNINFNQAGWANSLSDSIVRIVRTQEQPEKRYDILVGNTVAFHNLTEFDDRITLAKKIAADLPSILFGVANQAKQAATSPAARMTYDPKADPRQNQSPDDQG